MNNIKIISYCHIKNNSLYVKGVEIARAVKSDDLNSFLSDLYKSIPLNYPKFFKMDAQCKLGLLATEFLIRSLDDFESYNKQELALIFSNQASSLESDRKHISSIVNKQNYFPSPAVFVYTLPNILIGEIAIKHKITGENAFFISSAFDAELHYQYCESLLQTQQATSVISGWVNVDGKSAEAFVYCLKSLNFKEEKEGLEKMHSLQNIQKLYGN